MPTKNISHDLLAYLSRAGVEEELLRRIVASPQVANTNGDPAWQLEVTLDDVEELLRLTSAERRSETPASMQALVAAARAEDVLRRVTRPELVP